MIPPVPMPMGAGTASALGWINLTTRDSSGLGDPKGNILRIPSTAGFNPAIGDESRRSRSAPVSGGLRRGISQAAGSGASSRMPTWTARRFSEGSATRVLIGA